MATLVPQSHPVLHSIAEEVPVEDIPTQKIKKVIRDMRAALRSWQAEDATGVAIAAPQIGVPLRIFLVEDTAPSGEKEEDRLPTLIAINPEISKRSRKKRALSEGCLSVNGRYGTVERAERVRIRAYDENGNRYERGASGLLAQIFQHEIDHLDGILFVDRASELYDKEVPPNEPPS